ncbi:hypothetical protein F8388_003188 [Cannabis sativa]|uniref:Ribosomal RNA methyltransferase FtsJ domain-containing protein n=1 Tax=Cannabis sativa TaxID=3483 RepID=A0A7J6EEI2_CANSA|nr:hypothetical protein F8388_003188 [Cannabis sativa]
MDVQVPIALALAILLFLTLAALTSFFMRLSTREYGRAKDFDINFITKLLESTMMDAASVIGNDESILPVRVSPKEVHPTKILMPLSRIFHQAIKIRSRVIDEENEKLLKLFMSKDAVPQCTLTDIIIANNKKIDANVSSGVRLTEIYASTIFLPPQAAKAYASPTTTMADASKLKIATPRATSNLYERQANGLLITGADLDLCASRSGWTQIATRRVPRGSLVVCVDLHWVEPIPGAIFIQQDITKPQCKSEIKRVMRKYECFVFDLVLHDGAPNMGGAWAMEATVQNALVIDAVKLSTHLLAPKGTFVTKIFRSQDYNSVKYCLSKLFERVVVHKPNSSRSVSAEIFVLAFNYKAPAKINPRILDVRHLFQGAIEPQKKKVLHDLGRVAKKRHCHGYEDVDTTLRKVSTAAEFIWPETLLDILGSITSISFHDPTSLLINHHAVTTQEVKILCDDLGVLGKQDFKHLLKWRIHIRKALIGSEKTEVANVENERRMKMIE